MVVFLYNVPESNHISDNSTQSDVFANFETERSIAGLLDHFRRYVPDITGLNVNKPDWLDRLHGQKVFNYTYAFGLLSASTRPTFALESRRVDYIGAQPLGIYLSANKPHCSNLMAGLGFLCPQQHIICQPLSRIEAEYISRMFGSIGHLVLKPAYEESSVGLALVQNSPDNIRWAVVDLYDRLPGVQILQQYISGSDVTVPIIGRRSPHCLPAVVLSHEVTTIEPFVFDAKLKATKSALHYAPTSTWPDELRAELYRIAEAAFRFTDQRDYSRVDCRVTPDGRCYFIEVNANPQLGLGKASFAVSAGVAGLEVGQVFRAIVQADTGEMGLSPMASGL